MEKLEPTEQTTQSLDRNRKEMEEQHDEEHYLDSRELIGSFRSENYFYEGFKIHQKLILSPFKDREIGKQILLKIPLTF